jgi:hypothetical protein
LCNKVLELIIDDLQYLSYACNCSDATMQSNAPSSNNQYTITLFNIIIAKVRNSSIQRINTKPQIAHNRRSRTEKDQVARLMGLESEIHVVNDDILKK